MDIEENNEKKCYKLVQHLFENLNVCHNNSTSTTVFWNKYQIFIYEDFNYENESKSIIPEFNISKLLLTDNYLLCLDNSGNVHTVSLKFKNLASKKIKSTFQPQVQNIICMELCENITYLLKATSDTYYICVYKSCPEFQLEQEIALNNSETNNLNYNKSCLFHSYKLSKSEFEDIKGLFINQDNILWKQHNLFLISFDRLIIYGFLLSDNIIADSCSLVKLYTCPTSITDISVVQLNHLNMIIGLDIGTIIKIPLNISTNVHIVHLNVALHKMLAINDTIYYTDCITLWKSGKTFTKDVIFKQMFLTHVKDFILIGNKMLCTTFSNLVYIFNNDSDECYIKPIADKYCPANIILNNSDCLEKIMEKIEESNKIISHINDQKHYITTLALSNRQDVMDSLINYNIMVYENFNEIQEENLLTLIDDITDYYDPHSLYFLIKITLNTLQNKLDEILPNIIGNVKIHISLRTRKSILRTVSLTFKGQVKKISLVVPVKSTTTHFPVNKVYVSVKLITNIPGIFKTQQSMWALLHKKNIVLNAEHFIRVHKHCSNLVSLNTCREKIDDLIIKTMTNQYGHLFKFDRIPNKNTRLWSLYVKLPDCYEDLLKDRDNLKVLNVQKREAIAMQIITKEFLKLRKELNFDIGQDRVKLQIINDGFTKPLLKTSCENFEIAIDIKYFFINILYNHFKEFKEDMIFVDQALYTTIENLEILMKDCLKTGFSNTQEFINLYDQYQKVVMGNLLI